MPCSKFVIEMREAGVELVAELHTDQAGRGGVDGQLGEEFEQVDLALVVPLSQHLVHFAGDGGGVPAHVVGTQGRIVQHLFAAFGWSVEDDALAEDRLHERVCRALIEVLVAGAEEEFVGLGA